jgi:hypothetical protein
LSASVVSFMQIPERCDWFFVHAEMTMDASLQEVWSVLIDFECYHEWNTFVPFE